MMKSLKTQRKIVWGLVGSLIIGGAFIAGCSASGTGNSETLNPDIKVEREASQKPLSDARNTPAVHAARTVGPAVVGISNKAVARDWFNMPVEREGVGSGVIFKSDGYIVTNNHVIEGAREITVSLSDGRTFKGKVIGADALTDIAVVKVDAADLPTAVFGNSDDLVVGEPAIAIGNPMGLEFQGTVTAGVISALNRTLDITERRLKLIQTDAAISPGNSGGALVNADGEVIGINSIKISASGVEGLAFAIPINTVQQIIDQLLDKGDVVRPYLGVGVFDKESALRAGYELNVEKGVFVANMTLGGPADKAGIRRGDIILKIDGMETNTVADLRTAVAKKNVGDQVDVEIERDGSTENLRVTLEEMPQESR